MSLINTIGAATGKISAATGALSLINAAKAFFMDPSKQGIGGFTFSIPTGEELQLTCQITDHYAEDNAAMQDHITLDPVRMTLRGQVGELVYVQSTAEKFVNQVLDRLGPLAALSPSAQEASVSVRQFAAQYNQLNQAISTAATVAAAAAGVSADIANPDQAGNFFGYYPGNPQRTKQQSAYVDLRKKRDSRQLLTVVTPWDTHPNMVIESLTFSQDETTKDVSTVEVTLKEFRAVNILRLRAASLGRAASQKAKKVQNNPAAPENSVALDAVTKLVK